MKILSLRQFGRLVGVSHTAISKAIRVGRMSKSVVLDPEGKLRGINVAIGVDEWRRITLQKVTTLSMPPEQIIEREMTREEAKIVKEYYRAQRLVLSYREMSGELVATDNVRKAAFAVGRTVRDSLMNIPDRYSAVIAGLGDDSKAIHRVLTAAFKEALAPLQEESLMSSLPGKFRKKAP